MHLFRPIRESDLSGLIALARSTGGGLTTLPANEEFLGDRIYESVKAFNPRVSKPGAEYYLFALEDTATGEIVGVSGIGARVGGFEPWYSYEIRQETFSHPPLKIERQVPVLHLKREHRGPTEVCSLFLRADRRKGGAGRLLSLARFLFIASFRRRFTPMVIAEMRGFVDDTGKSPFWEAVGRHFFGHDYYAADVLSGLGEKEFIANLIPRHPLYVPLLPAAVQASLGRVHRDTEAALALLRSEGFAPMGEIDIFDAGPLVRAEVEQIRTIRVATQPVCREVAEVPETGGDLLLLANGALDYRACLSAVRRHDDETVTVPPATAEALGIAAGAKLWVSTVR